MSAVFPPSLPGLTRQSIIFESCSLRKWMDTRVKPAYDAEGAAVSLPFRECRFMQQAATRDEKLDLAGMVADLNSLLRLKTTVIGMKMFAPADEMEAIPKIRRPTAGHPTEQILSMASP